MGGKSSQQSSNTTDNSTIALDSGSMVAQENSNITINDLSDSAVEDVLYFARQTAEDQNDTFYDVLNRGYGLADSSLTTYDMLNERALHFAENALDTQADVFDSAYDAYDAAADYQMQALKHTTSYAGDALAAVMDSYESAYKGNSSAMDRALEAIVAGNERSAETVDNATRAYSASLNRVLSTEKTGGQSEMIKWALGVVALVGGVAMWRHA